MTGQVVFKPGVLPSAPPAGYVSLYAKSDGRFYFQDEFGNEEPLKPTGSGTGDLLADGSVPLTANWDVGAFKITAQQFESDIVTGTAPLVVASTTVVANLNADLLDGQEGSYYAALSEAETVTGAWSFQANVEIQNDIDVGNDLITDSIQGKTLDTNIAIAPSGTGNVSLGNLVFDADQTVGAGQDNYVLTYDNATGLISLEVATASGMSDLVDDTTPQLGGPLDVNSQKIVSASNGDIDIEPNGTGNVLLGNFTFDADQAVGAGQDNYVLTYDHASGLISLEASAGGGGGVNNPMTSNLDADTYGIYGTALKIWNDDTTSFLGLYADGTASVETNSPQIRLYSRTQSVQAITIAGMNRVTDVYAGSVQLHGMNAYDDATGVNIVGGDVELMGGSGATNAAGAADGGWILLQGGIPFGTGVKGSVYAEGHNIEMHLGDEAGVAKFSIHDSAGVEQWACDSDGNVTGGAGSTVGLQNTHFDVTKDEVLKWTCGDLLTEPAGTNNNLPYRYMDFDGTTPEYAVIYWQPPERWNGGTIKLRFHWKDTAGAASNGVYWFCGGRAIGDGDDMSLSGGTAQGILDTTQGDAKKRYISDWTPAMTLAGTPAKGDNVQLYVARNPNNVGDDLATDARLLGVDIQWTSDEENDA